MKILLPKKLVYIIIAILLVALVIVITFNATTNHQVIITNQVPGYVLQLDSEKKLQQFLKEITFWNSGTYSSFQYQQATEKRDLVKAGIVVNPRSLDIVLTPQQQSLLKLYQPGNTEPFQSYGYEYQKTKNTYRTLLYYSPQVLQEVSHDKQQFRERVSFDVLKMICLGSMYGDYRYGEEKCNSIVLKYSQHYPPFRLVKKSNLNSKLIEFIENISFLKIPKAFAACSGFYDCGNWSYSCSVAGGSCSNTCTNCCGPFGNGNCTRVCDSLQGQIACGWSNQTDCTANHCSAFNCSTAGSGCTWTGSTPVTPRPPTATTRPGQPSNTPPPGPTAPPPTQPAPAACPDGNKCLRGGWVSTAETDYVCIRDLNSRSCQVAGTCSNQSVANANCTERIGQWGFCCGPAMGTPECHPERITMTANPYSVDIGGQITFTLNGQLGEGSTNRNEVFTGGVNCTDLDWSTFPTDNTARRTCTAIASGPFKWTHTWEPCWPYNCTRTPRPICDKSVDYDVKVPTYTISGTVWLDLNANGTWQPWPTRPYEPTYTNSVVTLVFYNPSTGANYLAYTNGDNGTYSITLPAGTWEVSAAAPNGYAVSSTIPINVNLNANTPNVNFGLKGALIVEGTVWIDRNADGIKDPTTENDPPPQVAVIVYNTTMRTSTYAFTDPSSGYYYAAGLLPGNYEISLTAPSGYALSTGSPQTTSLPPNRSDINFGLRGNSNVSGYIFLDKDADGQWDLSTDEDDYYTAGVRILVRQITANGSILVADVTSDSSGQYATSNTLLPGNYRIQAIAPAGHAVSTGNPVDFSIILGSSNVHFGLRGTNNAWGRVWVDTNGDGFQDISENWYSGGATVTILMPDGRQQPVTTNSTGFYNFINLYPGTHEITLTAPPGYRVSTTNPRSVTFGPSPQRIDFGITGAYTISGTVFYDTTTGVGVFDAGENPYRDGNLNGANVSILKPDGYTINAPIDGNGFYSLTNLIGGQYTVTFTAPNRHIVTSNNPQTFTLGPSRVVDFGVRREIAVSGTIFNDVNRNRRMDAGETAYTGTITMSSTPNAADLLINNGVYNFTFYNPGTYTISFTTNLNNTGYAMVWPVNGNPPSFTVTIDPAACDATLDTSTGAYCTADNDVYDLNFAVTNSIPWVQAVGLDYRKDDGITNYVGINADTCPGGRNTAITGSSTTPGVLFSGNGTSSFGTGSSSSTGWLVGGTSYSESYPAGPLKTSYNSLLSTINRAGMNITDLATICLNSNILDCTLPGNTLPSGVYRANGNLNLNAVQFANNVNLIFLVNGSLTIRDFIRTPNTSTALFSASNNITVFSNVGSAPGCGGIGLQGNIQGVFSADSNFTVAGLRGCVNNIADRMLLIAGSVHVNASRGGGSFINNRDFCANNRSYPTVQFLERPDFILNAPGILKNKNYLYKELAP